MHQGLSASMASPGCAFCELLGICVPGRGLSAGVCTPGYEVSEHLVFLGPKVLCL